MESSSLKKTPSFEESVTEKLCSRCLQNNIQTQATLKCLSCQSRNWMCGSCRVKHDKIPVFKETHRWASMTEEGKLCQRHILVIQYVCVRCLDGVCQECVDDEEGQHKNHLEDIKELEEGIESVRNTVKTWQDDIYKVTEQVQLSRNSLHADIDAMLLLNDSLKEKREDLIRTANEYENDILREIAVKVAEPNSQQVNDLRELHDDLLGCSTELSILNIKDDMELLYIFKNHRNRVNELLQKSIQILNASYVRAEFKEGKQDNSFFPAFKTEHKKFSQRNDSIASLSRNVRDIQITSTVVLSDTTDKLRGVSFKMDTPLKILSYGKTLLYVDSALRYVQRLDELGHVIARYYHQFDNVQDAFVKNNKLYMAQKITITAIPLTIGEENTVYNPKISAIGAMAEFDENSIVITDVKSGHVVRFNLLDGVTKTVATKLKSPVDIVVVDHVDGKRIFVSEFTTSGSHTIVIFDQRWERNGIIKGTPDLEFCSLGIITVTRKSIILVPDRDRHTVSEFDHRGSFLRHLLSPRDGVQYPQCIALHDQRLWLLEADSKPDAHKKLKLLHISPRV